MVDKAKNNKMSQKAFENKENRSELNILKSTLKMAGKKCASGVDLDNIADAKGEGISGASTLMAESKKAAKEEK